MKRRDFLKAGVGAFGFPYLVPSSALGKGGGGCSQQSFGYGGHWCWFYGERRS